MKFPGVYDLRLRDGKEFFACFTVYKKFGFDSKRQLVGWLLPRTSHSTRKLKSSREVITYHLSASVKGKSYKEECVILCR